MKLPKVIADLLEAQGKYDSMAFAENFSDDAIVHDEGKKYSGKSEIRQWNEMTNAKYKTKYEPLEISNSEDEIILTAKISGTFDGSPVNLDYHFTIETGKIDSLSVS